MAQQTAFRKRPDGHRSRQYTKSSSFVLVLIGVFKLLKAVLLIAVGIGAIKFLHKDIGASVTHWMAVLRVDPDNRFIARAPREGLPSDAEATQGGKPEYFPLCGPVATEGIGLLLRKRWPEYFTLITTSATHPA